MSTLYSNWHNIKSTCGFNLEVDKNYKFSFQVLCKVSYYNISAFLSPMLTDVSPAAGSNLMSFGSTGRGLLISVSEGPLWGGAGKSSGWERSAKDSRPSCFIAVLPLLSSTMQSSCSSEAPSNTFLSSVRENKHKTTLKTTVYKGF